MNLNKRKPAIRPSSNERLLAERNVERGGRPSILDNQKIEPRMRHRLQEIQQEGARIEQRAQQVARESLRRRTALAASAGEHPLGVRLLEGGVVLAAGLSLMIRNGFGQIAGLIRDGRDRVSGLTRRRPRPWEIEEQPVEEPEEEMWHREEGGSHGGSVRVIGLTGVGDAGTTGSMQTALQSPLRQEVERTKVQRLDAEEQDLPEEHLEDQLGALRARLTSLSRPG
ncbi:MAG: hypothetical protein H7834_08205 [Magnetococcus sp. YQC-9]